MKYTKWILGAVGLTLVFAIYKSETTRLAGRKLIVSNLPVTKPVDTAKHMPAKTSALQRQQAQDRIYVQRISGDTLDISKGKFIMILADRFKDQNITYGVSMWHDQNACAWSPGTFKIVVLDRNGEILKSATTEIDKQLGSSCQQLEELNIFMGDLIYRSHFINAEFTDEDGETYYQWRKRLGEILE
jgi:hypothetical protein